MSDQREVDEFGIPIKKAPESKKQEFDEFGIPIKKKEPIGDVSATGTEPTFPSKSISKLPYKEVKKKISDYDKQIEKLKYNLNTNYSGLEKELNDLNTNYESVAAELQVMVNNGTKTVDDANKDLENLKKEIESKYAEYQSAYDGLNTLVSERNAFAKNNPVIDLKSMAAGVKPATTKVDIEIEKKRGELPYQMPQRQIGLTPPIEKEEVVDEFAQQGEVMPMTPPEQEVEEDTTSAIGVAKKKFPDPIPEQEQMLSEELEEVGKEIQGIGIRTTLGVVDVPSVLEQNKDKNFVKRILNPEQYASLDEGDGFSATHKMAWGETDGKYVVYPTIVQDRETGELKELSPDEAFKYAIKSGEFIEFPSAKEADFFSQQYKTVWGESPEIEKIPKFKAGAEFDIPNPDYYATDNMNGGASPWEQLAYKGFYQGTPEEKALFATLSDDIAEYLEVIETTEKGRFQQIKERIESGRLREEDRLEVVATIKSIQAQKDFRDIRIAAYRQQNGEGDYEGYIDQKINAYNTNVEEIENLYKVYPKVQKEVLNQEAMNTWYEQAKQSGDIFMMFDALSSTAGKKGLETIEKTLIALPLLTARIGSNFSETARSVSYDLEDFSNYITPTIPETDPLYKVKTPTGDEWRVDPMDLAVEVAAQSFQMFFLYGKGAQATQGALQKIAGQNISKNAGLFTVGFLSTYDDLYQDALDAGLSPSDANTFSIATSSLVAAGELISPNEPILNGKLGDFLETAVRLHKGGSTGKAFQQAFYNYAGDVIKENGQELFQTTIENVAKITTDATVNGSEFGAELFNKDEIYSTILITTLSTTLARTKTSVKELNSAKNGLYLLAENYETFSNELPNLVEGKVLTQQEATRLDTRVKAVIEAKKKVPQDMPETKKANVVPLVAEKDELEAQKKELDPIFQPPVQERIDAINVEIVAESQPKPTESVEVDLPEDIRNLKDDEIISYTVESLDKVPEKFRERARKTKETEVEVRSAILGLPIGPKKTKILGGGFTYSLSGREAKDHAIQELNKVGQKESPSVQAEPKVVAEQGEEVKVTEEKVVLDETVKTKEPVLEGVRDGGNETQVGEEGTQLRPQEKIQAEEVKAEKEVVKEPPVQKELTPEQNKQNTLVAKIKDYNELTPAKRRTKEGTQIGIRIGQLAQELDFDLQTDNKSGRIKATNKAGKKVISVSVKEEVAEPREEDIAFTKQQIYEGTFNWSGQPHDPKIDLGLPWTEVKKGIADIQKGVMSVPAKRVANAMRKVQEDGGYIVKINVAGQKTELFIPLNEVVKEYTAEQDDADAAMYDAWFESLSPEQKEAEFYFTEYGEDTETEPDQIAEGEALEIDTESIPTETVEELQQEEVVVSDEVKQQRQEKASSFGYSNPFQAVESINKNLGKEYTIEDFENIPESEFKEAASKSKSVERNKAKEEKVKAIEAKRAEIFKRIADKTKGKLTSGIDPSIIPDLIELGATYVEEGIVKASDFIARMREDLRALGIDDTKISDEEFEEQIFSKIKLEAEGGVSRTSADSLSDITLKSTYGEIKTGKIEVAELPSGVVDKTISKDKNGNPVKVYINYDNLKNVLLSRGGKSIFRAMQGRFFVIAKVGDFYLPFYISSAGTSGKIEGEWYPFFGYNNWLVKGSVGKKGEMAYTENVDNVTKLLNENLKIPAKYFTQFGQITNGKGTPANPDMVFYDINEDLNYESWFIDFDRKKGNTYTEDDFITDRTGLNPKNVVNNGNGSADNWIKDVLALTENRELIVGSIINSPKPKTKKNDSGKKVKEAGRSKAIREDRIPVATQELKDKIKNSPLLYKTYGSEQAVDDASNFFSQFGEITADNWDKIAAEISKLDIFSNRWALLAGNLHVMNGFDIVSELREQGKEEEADSLAENALKFYNEYAAKSSTSLGQANAALAQLYFLTEEGMALFLTKTANRAFDASRVNKMRKRIAKGDMEAIKKGIEATQRKTAEKMAEGVRTGKVAPAVKRKARGNNPNAYKAKIAEGNKKIADGLAMLRKSRGNMSFGGLSPELIEGVKLIAEGMIIKGSTNINRIYASIRNMVNDEAQQDLSREDFGQIFKDAGLEDLRKEVEKKKLDGDKFLKSKVKEEIKAQDILAELTYEYYSGNKGGIDGIVSAMQEELGLTEDEANSVKARLDTIFNQILEEENKKMLRRKFRNNKNISSKKVNDAAKDFAQYVQAGALDTDYMMQSLKDAYGIQELTAKDVEEIKRLSEKLFRANVFKDDVAKEIAEFVVSKLPVDAFDVCQGLWYASVLSGVGTQLANIKGNFDLIRRELRALKLIDAFDAVKQKDGTFLLPSKESARRYTDSLFQAMNFVLEAFKNGATNNKYMEENIAEFKKNFSVERINTLKGKTKLGNLAAFTTRAIYTGPKYVVRGLEAFDQGFGSYAFDAMASLALKKRYRKQGLRGKALQQAVANDLFGTEEIRQEVSEEVYQEMLDLGMNPKDFLRARKGISNAIRAKLDPEVRKEANRFAALATLKGTPTGSMGLISKTIQGMNNTLVFTKYIIPFVNVPLNLVNRSYDYLPLLGIARAYGISVSGLIENRSPDFLSSKGVDTSAAKTAREKQLAWARQGVWALTSTVLYTLTQMKYTDDDGEEKPILEVTGSREYMDYYRRKDAERVSPSFTFTFMGYGPISYKLLPVAPTFIVFGEMMDREKYPDDPLFERTFTERMALYTASVGRYFLEALPIQGIENIVNTMARFNRDNDTPADEKAVKAFTDAIIKQGGTIAMPNLYKQGLRVFDPKAYTSETLKEAVYKSLNISFIDEDAGYRFDGFGRADKYYPAEKYFPYRHISGELGNDRVDKLMAEKGISPSELLSRTIPYKSVAIEFRDGVAKTPKTINEIKKRYEEDIENRGLGSLGRQELVDELKAMDNTIFRFVTPKEWQDMSIHVGKEVYKSIDANYDYLKGLDEKELESAVKTEYIFQYEKYCREVLTTGNGEE